MIRLFIILITTLAGAAWIWYSGPMHVVRVSTELDDFVPSWYTLTAFPVLGILLADLYDKFKRHGFNTHVMLFAAEIALIILLSNVRLGIRIPLSGHSLVAAYCLFRRRPEFINPALWKVEIALTASILFLIAYIKLAWWLDPITLLTGIAIGAILAVIGIRLERRNLHRQSMAG